MEGDPPEEEQVQRGAPRLSPTSLRKPCPDAFACGLGTHCRSSRSRVTNHPATGSPHAAREKRLSEHFCGSATPPPPRPPPHLPCPPCCRSRAPCGDSVTCRCRAGVLRRYRRGAVRYCDCTATVLRPCCDCAATAPLLRCDLNATAPRLRRNCAVTAPATALPEHHDCAATAP
eukprot:288045-Prorocentrum_minimum.AAC.1